jgi:uncharacterized protein YdhG (YjbR/CyaY superfamily)
MLKYGGRGGRAALVRRCVTDAARAGCAWIAAKTQLDSDVEQIFRLEKDLVGLSSQTGHCSLHSLSPPLVKAMANELQGFKVSGATIHFSPETPLPRELVENVLQARIQELDKSS